jgi:transmembrane sensor
MTKSSKVVQFPDYQKIQEEAAMWVARCDTRELVGAHREEFVKWLSQSPVHREEFESLSCLWGGFDILDELNYVEESDSDRSERKRTLWGGWRALTAAAAVLVVSIGVLVDYPGVLPDEVAQSASFETLLGAQKRVTLRDGSTMIINTDSKVEVNFTEDLRDIHLIRGEVHFDVAHNPERPFSVYAGAGVAQAVGTAFTVQLNDSVMEVTVSEGRVALLSKLESEELVSHSISGPLRKEPMIEIAAGDSAVMTREKLELLKPLSDSELVNKLSWQRGILAFAGEPLSEVLEEISRYTPFEIQIDDARLETLPIGGYFKIGEVEEFLRALEGTLNVDVERVGEGRVRLSYRS